VSIIPGFFILGNQHAPNFYFIFWCLHTIQLIGTLVPIFSLSMRLLPDYFTPTRTVVCFVCFTTDLVLSLFFWDVPTSAWMYAMYLIPAGISQGAFLLMLFRWFQNLHKRCSIQLPVRRLAFELVSLMTPDELRCAVYLVFCNISLVIVTAAIGMFSRFTFIFVPLPDLLGAIYILASFSVLSSCVPNRILQYIALKQDLKIKISHTTIRYISHEIRSPLNIVQNGIMLVIDDLQNPCRCDISEVLDTLADVRHASIAASSIVDDLLNFEKIEDGTFKIEQKLLPASSYFSQIAGCCRVLAEHKGIQFEVHNLLDSVAINDTYTLATYVDALRMEQVIRNLIVNSIKFTPTGGSISVLLKNRRIRNVDYESNESSRSSHCQVHCIHEAGLSLTSSQPISNESKSAGDGRTKTIFIEITDTGVGMTKQQIDSVFGQFVQFNANALQGGGGSGLGLWICKQIVEQHQGKISIFSKGPGHGTTVSIELNGLRCERSQLAQQAITNLCVTQDLPLVCYSMSCEGITSTTSIEKQTKMLTTYAEVQPFSGPRPKAEEGCETVRILVVDDSALNRKILIKMLKRIQAKNLLLERKVAFDFHEVDDGLPALKVITSEIVHVVFIDNIMLHMNGPATVKLMREEHKFRGKIIGVTGNSLDADVRDFLDKGADSVLIKPVKWENLCEMMPLFN